MARILNEKRKYKRILLSADSASTLEQEGFELVFSSNVSAMAKRGDALIIRFHNGSIYRYPNQADRYESMMAAASKGKWVWRNLRKANVPYQKIGSLPLPEDKIVEDDVIMKPPIARVETVVPIDALTTGNLPQISITPLQMLSTMTNTGSLSQLGIIASLASL